MSKIYKIVLFVFLVSSTKVFAQNTTKIHSHNDYNQNIPFWNAYASGANSLEADIFLKKTNCS